MKNKRFKMLFAVGVILSIFSFTACGSTEEENKSNSENEQMQETEEEKKGFFDASYTTETTIAYSAGNDSDWSYGNQRKEFPIDDACYVRIASTAITDKNKGVDNEIAVTYRFTGTENCQVNLSDGIAEQIDTGDANVTEFTRTIFAKKSKEAEEDIIIFQYVPTESAESITLEVLYDDQIDSRYDCRNTVYFVSSETEETEDVRKENGTK